MFLKTKTTCLRRPPKFDMADPGSYYAWKTLQQQTFFFCMLRLSSHAYQEGGDAPRHASYGVGAMGISNLALYTNGTMRISENNAAHEGGGHIWLCICHVHTTPQTIGQLQRVLQPIAAFSASDRRADWPGGEPRPWAPNRWELSPWLRIIPWWSCNGYNFWASCAFPIIVLRNSTQAMSPKHTQPCASERPAAPTITAHAARP